VKRRRLLLVLRRRVCGRWPVIPAGGPCPPTRGRGHRQHPALKGAGAATVRIAAGRAVPALQCASAAGGSVASHATGGVESVAREGAECDDLVVERSPISHAAGGVGSVAGKGDDLAGSAANDDVTCPVARGGAANQAEVGGSAGEATGGSPAGQADGGSSAGPAAGGGRAGQAAGGGGPTADIERRRVASEYEAPGGAPPEGADRRLLR